MQVDDLLQHLKKVKKTGPGRWIACCPSHDDKSPSLSIKDSNGTILCHCFGGCEIHDILGAVGMVPSDLFPPRDPNWKPDEQRSIGVVKFTAIDALRCLSYEGGVLSLAAADMAEGKVLNSQERDRLYTSCGRIAAALEYLEQN